MGMAISGCMSCLKTCGYLCGGLAALNIWFWLGMTIFNSMDNLWLKKNVMKYEGSEWATADASKFTTIFGMCILLNVICMVACCGCTKSACYQDKDKVEYYVGGGGSKVRDSYSDFSQQRNINPSNEGGSMGVDGQK